jgi:fucose 4-O-acetylase-like acetyltransferase
MNYSYYFSASIFPQRKQYIDALRGLSMIVVVYGHCLLSKSRIDYSAYFVFFSPINVALFFTISGYLFKPKNSDFDFFKNIFFRLVIPWFALGLFPYNNIQWKLPLLLLGKSLWFMNALIIGEILWYYIHKISKNNEKMVILLGLFVSASGLLCFRFGWLNDGMINRGMVILWFLVLGLIIRKYESVLVNLVRKYMIWFSILLLLMGAFFMYLYPGEFYDVKWNRYYFIPLTWGMIIVGILIAFTLFSTAKHIPQWIVLIGQNTLTIYILHEYVLSVFRKLLSMSGFNSDILFPAVAVLGTIFSCGCCLAFSLLANRYLPEIVGRKRKKV